MIKVLIVDDSSVVRSTFRRQLGQDPDIEVVGVAPDPYVARDLIAEKKPDVVTLDIEMPRMDGLTLLRKIMRYHPLPVVIVSSLTSAQDGELALEALATGAVEVMSKGAGASSYRGLAIELVDKVKAAAQVDVKRWDSAAKVAAEARPAGALSHTTNQILAIGASTGGTVAIETIARGMPANGPGTVIAQHMPAPFTRTFAERLNTVSKMQIREAEDGDRVVPGVLLIAPGDKHMMLRRVGTRYHVNVKHGPRINRHRPSVDILFRSVAESAGRNAVGVILTGMGEDGAKGLLLMKEAGAPTIAQDEASSVIFGMPKVAINLGAADEVLDIERMSGRILKLCRNGI